MIKMKMIFTVLLITLGFQLNGQSIFTLGENTKIHVKGASNVSDWELEALGYNCELELNDSTPLEVGLKSISKLNFEIPVDKIVSERGPIMDKKVRNALKFEQHPRVTYTSTSNELTEVDGHKVTILFHGILSMAGVEKNVDIKVRGEFSNDQKTLKMQGEKALKLSMFDIERPTAFFGKLTTNDDIEIKLDLTFTKTIKQ
ncbi:YceI family protein [Flavivirga eckloniae]|uniref:Lipid/polyisoprenoid-binding YceI-like domain-containing protein n=1 Tax=Flavivirga eckloniae TaxID=1803846 RepID=A0A2K9PW01_9FLAO|nr:YceI family protein [Flavivirga eckloniae]AUP80697.1 hypothetical protein C1H87_19050 [Flavivirga eckloniae]